MTPDDRRRRADPRHLALENRAWVGWWAGPEFLAVDVRLLDISRGGVALLADRSPPGDRPLWLCLHAGRRSWGAEVRLVGAVPWRGGGLRLRARFAGACPEGLYRAAVGGLRPGRWAARRLGLLGWLGVLLGGLGRAPLRGVRAIRRRDWTDRQSRCVR